ncbi:MAG: hypothetical protein ACLFTU_02670 [Puniceicoccaceae bacterium]
MASGDTSGYSNGNEETDEQAAGFLETLIRSGKRGLPAHGLEIIVKPKWHEGRSL